MGRPRTHNPDIAEFAYDLRYGIRPIQATVQNHAIAGHDNVATCRKRCIHVSLKPGGNKRRIGEISRASGICGLMFDQATKSA